jgi:hypothetical protein
MGIRTSSLGVLRKKLLAAGVIVSFSLSLAAQPAGFDSATAQREAMSKLSFLAGRWSGPVSIVRGPEGALHLTQTEQVEYKLDGLVLLIEGKSTNADSKVLFSALATIAFDDSSHAYRFRAYNDGHYVDTELSAIDKGFSWSFTAGPARITNTMHLTGKGEWREVTDVAFGNTPPHRSVDMMLQRQPDNKEN